MHDHNNAQPADTRPDASPDATQPDATQAATQPPATKALNPSPSRKQIRKWRRYLAEERMEAGTYVNLARRCKDPGEAHILQELARAESRHEAHWLALLGTNAYPTPRASLRSYLFSYFAQVFGSIFVLALMQRAESRSAYETDQDATSTMAADERVHAEVVRALTAKARARMAGTFRAAIFGMNDGLVSNLALVIGVFAAGVSTNTVLLTGIAGLLAGAFSMAAGEYVSVRSQRELLEAGNADESIGETLKQLEILPRELALIFEARGLDAKAAKTRAEQIFNALNKGVNRQLETDSKDFLEVGSPALAALSSFGFFALGAALPLLPFLLGLAGSPAVILALALVAVALFFTGSFVGVMAGTNPLSRALRQMFIGFAAAGLTYGFGAIFGVVAA